MVEIVVEAGVELAEAGDHLAIFLGLFFLLLCHQQQSPPLVLMVFLAVGVVALLRKIQLLVALAVVALADEALAAPLALQIPVVAAAAFAGQA